MDGDHGRLYAEGFLMKLQPFGSMNRMRWFVLTAERLAYYTTEGGECMASVPCSDIEFVMPRGNDAYVWGDVFRRTREQTE